VRNFDDVMHQRSASWPSLFVGAAGTCSSLHVDQWHGHFWMVMVAGRKRWTLFHPDDIEMLYPDYSRGTLYVAFCDASNSDGDGF